MRPLQARRDLVPRHGLSHAALVLCAWWQDYYTTPARVLEDMMVKVPAFKPMAWSVMVLHMAQQPMFSTWLPANADKQAVHVVRHCCSAVLGTGLEGVPVVCPTLPYWQTVTAFMGGKSRCQNSLGFWGNVGGLGHACVAVHGSCGMRACVPAGGQVDHAPTAGARGHDGPSAAGGRQGPAAGGVPDCSSRRSAPRAAAGGARTHSRRARGCCDGGRQHGGLAAKEEAKVGPGVPSVAAAHIEASAIAEAGAVRCPCKHAAQPPVVNCLAVPWRRTVRCDAEPPAGGSCMLLVCFGCTRSCCSSAAHTGGQMT